MRNLPLYCASVAATATTAGAAGVICNIVGSASVGTAVRVHKITISGVVATTAEMCRFNLFRRTLTTASAGTSAAMVPFTLDSRAPAASATANYWTAVGTVGTGGGLLETRGTLLGLAASATISSGTVDFVAPSFSDPTLPAWTLRGVLESLEVTTVAALANAPTFAVSILFSEDNG